MEINKIVIDKIDELLNILKNIDELIKNPVTHDRVVKKLNIHIDEKTGLLEMLHILLSCSTINKTPILPDDFLGKECQYDFCQQKLIYIVESVKNGYLYLVERRVVGDHTRLGFPLVRHIVTPSEVFFIGKFN